MVDKTVETFARPQGERAPAAGFAQATLLQNSGDMMRKTYWQGCLKSAVIPLCLAAAVADAAGPFPFTEEWYRQRSDDPAGTRQIEKDGKLWPPYPRPVGRKQTFKHGYHSAHYWPHPYNMEDRAYVENLLAQQTASGWVMATTLHDYYFHIETQKLNEAGQNQLIWIAATAPPQFRTVYVAEGNSIGVTQLRVAEVERYFQMAGIANAPPILTRREFFTGRPASEVDRLRTMEMDAIPTPRLFSIGAGSALGGGTSGGSGAGGSSKGTSK